MVAFFIIAKLYYALRFFSTAKTVAEVARKAPARARAIATHGVSFSLGGNPVLGSPGVETRTVAKAYPTAVKPLALPWAVAVFIVDAVMFAVQV